MRIMGLDVGDKRIGVAVSDELGLTAQGVEVIRRSTSDQDFTRLHEIMVNYDIERVVIGWPKNMNGTVGPRAEKCEEFAHEVENRFGVPIVLWDERLTTVAAERTLLAADVSRKRRRQVVDKLAAGLILQAYLDARRRKESHV